MQVWGTQEVVNLVKLLITKYLWKHADEKNANATAYLTHTQSGFAAVVK